MLYAMEIAVNRTTVRTSRYPPFPRNSYNQRSIAFLLFVSTCPNPRPPRPRLKNQLDPCFGAKHSVGWLRVTRTPKNSAGRSRRLDLHSPRWLNPTPLSWRPNHQIGRCYPYFGLLLLTWSRFGWQVTARCQIKEKNMRADIVTSAHVGRRGWDTDKTWKRKQFWVYFYR